MSVFGPADVIDEFAQFFCHGKQNLWPICAEHERYIFAGARGPVDKHKARGKENIGRLS